MSAANYAVMQTFALNGAPVDDCLRAPNAASQTTATRLKARMNRFTTSNAGGTGSSILPQLLTGETGSAIIVINDTPNAMVIYPAAGETINALSANANISVPSGQSAICIPNDVPLGVGGVATVSLLNWRVGIIP